MTPERTKLLEELAAYGRAHDARRPDRLKRLRNLEPESARLLWVLLRVMRARRVLELGTSNGYSTIWLADAVAGTGDGRVTTVEIDAERARQAQDNFVRAGLAERIELTVAEAVSALARSPDDAWDAIFLDAERPHYVDYWPDLFRSLRPLGLLAVDNVLSHPDEVAAFRRLIETSPSVSASLSPTGAGLLLVVKEPPDEAI
ncbi:MAG: O-methyltransferase [Solirubrobacteraceae bacterium]